MIGILSLDLSSRTRTAGKGHNNGTPRYNSGGYGDGAGAGGGPMRHSASAWARHNARPYDNIPFDHASYDRARSYDIRSEPQRYYDDRREDSYGLEYDAPRYARHAAAEPPEARHYREVSSNARGDGYAPSR